MSRSADQILVSRLTAHCPDGFAWPKDEASNVAGYLYPGAGLIADAEALLDALKLEINPGTATLLLSDYEQTLGPDPCGRDGLALTTPLRQSLAHQRWVSVGDNTIPFFQQMGAYQGVEIEIEEPEPPHHGRTRCGTRRYGTDAQRRVLVVTLPHQQTGLECPIQQSVPADLTLVIKYKEAV